MNELDDFAEPDADSDYDYEESYKRNKRRRSAKTPGRVIWINLFSARVPDFKLLDSSKVHLAQVEDVEKWLPTMTQWETLINRSLVNVSLVHKTENLSACAASPPSCTVPLTILLRKHLEPRNCLQSIKNKN